MIKKGKALLLFTVLLTLCACGGGKGEQPGATKSPEVSTCLVSPSAAVVSTPSVPPVDKEEIDNDHNTDLFDQIIIKLAAVESMVIDTKMETETIAGGETSALSINEKTRMTADAAHSILTIYGEGGVVVASTEHYIFKDAVYSTSPILPGSWTKMTPEPDELDLSTIKTTNMPQQHLSSLKMYTDQSTISEIDGNYLYQFHFNEGKYDELTAILSATAFFDAIEESDIEIAYYNTTIAVDKDTMLPTEVSVETNFSYLLEDGELAVTTLTLDYTYSDYNTTGPIVLPEEAKQAEALDLGKLLLP